jgi:hypothetical protein
MPAMSSVRSEDKWRQTRARAEAQAAEIRSYWEKRGIECEVRVERFDLTEWAVRSDLLLTAKGGRR